MASRLRRLRNRVAEATGLRAPETPTGEPPPRRFAWLPWRREPRPPRISPYTLALAQVYGRGIVAEREARRRRQRYARASSDDDEPQQAPANTAVAAAILNPIPLGSPATSSTSETEPDGEEVRTGGEVSSEMVDVVARAAPSRRATDTASQDHRGRGARHDAPTVAAEPMPPAVIPTPGRDQRDLTGEAGPAAVAVGTRPRPGAATPSEASSSESFGTPPSTIPSAHWLRANAPTAAAEGANDTTAASLTPSERTHPLRDQARRDPTGGEAAAAAAESETVTTPSSWAASVPGMFSESSSVFNPLIMFGEGATIRPEPAHTRSGQAQGSGRRGAPGEAAGDATRQEARATSDVAVSSGASTESPMPAPTPTRRGTGETTRWLNRILASFHEQVAATPPLRIQTAGERRLIYPPLVLPVPTHIMWYQVSELFMRMMYFMERRTVDLPPIELRGVPLDPLPPPPSSGGDQTQGRARVDEGNQRWVLARTAEVPIDREPLPADANGLSWTCPLCFNLRAFPSPRRLAAHMAARHLGRRIFMCGPCTTGELFLTYDSMLRHFIRAHGGSA